MGVQMEVKQQSTTMFRLVGDQIVKENRVQNLYVVPPKGEYRFMITGYADPFEMPKSADYGGGTQVMTRIELTIIEGPGKGKMFDQMWGFTIGEKSNLGGFLRRMGVDLSLRDGTFDLDRIIGYTGSGYLTPSTTLGDDGKPRYTKLSIETVDGLGNPDRDYVYGEAIKPSATASAQPQTADTDDGWPTN